MRETLRILRYNTGTDKKAFVEFKEHFDAVIFNAAIVAYSGSSVADLVSMHKRKYIIDPQTHIFQQDISAISTENKKTHTIQIKKSVEKYLSQLPPDLSNALMQKKHQLSPNEVVPYVDALVTDVYDFQTKYVDGYIKGKEYDKYLEFAKLGPEPRMLIAPYFMLKDSYDDVAINDWLDINSTCMRKTIQKNLLSNNPFPIAAQIVLDKAVMLSNNFVNKIKAAYSDLEFEYVFIWVDDFDSFDARIEHVKAFAQLVTALNDIGKKPMMAYGGYESIILCNSESPSRLYGVAQSVGYGEYRPITPIGGGLPVNKYYFLPTHRRLRFDDAAKILSTQGYFSNDKSDAAHAEDYYVNICDCKQCHEIIKKDINNFDKYNDSISFDIRKKNGVISRNRPTTDASLIAALHFLYCKVDEWENVETKDFNSLISELKENCKTYNPLLYREIEEWCKVYECKAD